MESLAGSMNMRKSEAAHPPGRERLRDFPAGSLRIVFDLEGGVRDAEVFFDFFLQGGKEGVVERGVAFYDMGGEGGFGGAERPDVEMMDACHAADFGEELLNFFWIDGCGHGVEGEAEGFPEEAPGADEDDKDNHETGDGIDPPPIGEGHHDAGDHDSERYRGIRGHVKEGAADIEVVLASGHEEHGSGAIDEDADAGHPCDGAGLDACGMTQTGNGLPCDAADANEEQEGVGQGGEDGGAFETVGVALGSGTFCKHGGDPRKHEAKDVAEIMARVREQGEGVGEEPGDDFDGDEGRVERDADEEGASEVLGWGVGMPVAV